MGGEKDHGIFDAKNKREARRLQTAAARKAEFEAASPADGIQF